MMVICLGAIRSHGRLARFRRHGSATSTQSYNMIAIVCDRRRAIAIVNVLWAQNWFTNMMVICLGAIRSHGRLARFRRHGSATSTQSYNMIAIVCES